MQFPELGEVMPHRPPVPRAETQRRGEGLQKKLVLVLVLEVGPHGLPVPIAEFAEERRESHKMINDRIIRRDIRDERD